jgi:hypothetical protein
LEPLQLPGRPGHPNHPPLLVFDAVDLSVLGRTVQVGQPPPVPGHPRIPLGHQPAKLLLEEGTRAGGAGTAQEAAGG